MDLKFKLSFSILFFTSIFLTSCTLLTRSVPNDNKRFVVNSFWAQDTLARSSNEFRKVNRMTPVVYKNLIILGNAHEGLVSYDLSTKNEVWRLDIPYGVESSGTAINDRLFIGSNSGKMYSVNMGNGEIVWIFDTKSEVVAEPLLHDGVLYFLSGSQSLYALDATNGKQLWVYSRQDTTNIMTIRGGAKPSISDRVLYAGFSDGALVALSSATGTIQWEITLNRNAKFKDIDASPVIDGEYIYLNSYDDMIYCLSKDKGEIIWKSAYGGFSIPIIFEEKVITTSSKGEIVALSKKDGQSLWIKKSKNGIFIDPLLFKSMIVSGESQGGLIFFNKDTGEQMGQFEPGRGVFSKPAIAQNLLYFISGEGIAYGVSAEFESKSSIYYLK